MKIASPFEKPHAERRSTDPFAEPAHLHAGLARLRAYWDGLKRGAAEMPFADDFDMTRLHDLAGELMLIDVFETPERFRFNYVGSHLAEGGLGQLLGRFIDEVELESPFDFLRAQCTATVEAAAPTFHRHEDGQPYARLLAPMWGDGRISLLVGVVARG